MNKKQQGINDSLILRKIALVILALFVTTIGSYYFLSYIDINRLMRKEYKTRSFPCNNSKSANYDDSIPWELKYPLAKEVNTYAIMNMENLTKRLLRCEAGAPYLHTRNCFLIVDLLKEPYRNSAFPYLDNDVKNYLRDGTNYCIIDPWGTPYLYDGVNALLHSAGPDKIFGVECAENMGDDVMYLFQPDFYVTNVRVDDSRLLATITFNKSLKIFTDMPENSVEVYEDVMARMVNARVLLKRIVFSNNNNQGTIEIHFLKPFRENKRMCCFVVSNLLASDGTPYFGGFMSFTDLQYKHLKLEERGKFNNHNIPILPIEKLVKKGIVFKFPKKAVKLYPDCNSYYKPHWLGELF